MQIAPGVSVSPLTILDSYKLTSRDALGFAAKATYVEYLEDGVIKSRDIFKQPKTDPGKNSARGLVGAAMENGSIVARQFTKEEFLSEKNLRVPIYRDGCRFGHAPRLGKVRAKITEHVNSQTK